MRASPADRAGVGQGKIAMRSSQLVREVGAKAWQVTGLGAVALCCAMLMACAVGNVGLPAPEVTGSLPAKPGDATATAGAAAHGAPAVPGARPAVAKVVMLLPMSGPGQLAVIAKAMKQAGELALFERDNPEFQLVVKDDKGTPEGARAAAEEAVRDGAEILLGPLMATSVQAVAPVAAAARIPVIAFSNDRRVAGPGVYLLSFMPDQEVERIVSYAAAQGRRNFAALVSDDTYGRIAEGAFTKAVAEARGNVFQIERYSGGGTGMLEPTRKLAEALTRAGEGGGVTADALLLPGGPETLTSIGPLLAYAKLDTAKVKLLGTAGWDAPHVGRDTAFVGAWFPAPDPRGWQSMSEKFIKTFGLPPPRMASLAFDAVGIALTLAQGTGAGRLSPAEIMRPGGFTGADGPVRFEQDGVAVRSLGVHEVQAFGSNMIEPPQLRVPAPPTARVTAAPAASVN